MNEDQVNKLIVTFQIFFSKHGEYIVKRGILD
jgi:hypothetical protein